MRTILATAPTIILLVSPALAQTSAETMTAREIAKQGLEAYDAHDYETAADRLGEAYAVVRVPTLALYRARALVKLGRLVEASELYQEAANLDVHQGRRVEQEQAQRQAKDERKALLSRVPKLTVVVKGADPSSVRIRVDAQEVRSALLTSGYAVDPGPHSITGELGKQSLTADVDLEAGARETVTLEFRAVVPQGGTALESGTTTDTSTAVPEDSRVDAPGWQRPTGWVTVGIGGAAFVMGVVSGVSAKNKREDLLHNGCDQDGSCYDENSGDVDAYNRSLRLANVGFIAGGVVTAAGVALVLTAPKPRKRAGRVTPWVSVGSAGVRGRF